MPNSSALTPAPCQVVAMIIIQVFSGESSSQRRSWPGRWRNCSASVSAPSVCRMNVQMTPTATPEMAYGNRNGSLYQNDPWMPWASRAITSPSPTGRAMVPTTQYRVFSIAL